MVQGIRARVAPSPRPCPRPCPCRAQCAGGGGSEAKKKSCVPKIGLKFPAPLINFIFCRRTIFSDVVWVGRLGLARAPNNLPPPGVTQRWPASFPRHLLRVTRWGWSVSNPRTSSIEPGPMTTGPWERPRRSPAGAREVTDGSWQLSRALRGGRYDCIRTQHRATPTSAPPPPPPPHTHRTAHRL